MKTNDLDINFHFQIELKKLCIIWHRDRIEICLTEKIRCNNIDQQDNNSAAIDISSEGSSLGRAYTGQGKPSSANVNANEENTENKENSDKYEQEDVKS